MKQRKNKINGTSKAGTIIAAVCIIIYLVALVQAVIRLYMSVEQQRVTADREFTNIANLATSDGARGFMDERFIETMNNALASSTSIEALIITGPEGEYAFERQKGRAVIWVNNSPRFINKFYFSNNNLQKPLQINNLRNVNIHALAGIFNFSDFSKILKETLFLILIGFAFAFFTMLIQLLLAKQPEISYIQKNSEQENSENEPEQIVANSGASSGANSGAKGPFSPRSNIGWEEYTKDSLDSELHRCASTEKDLTLIILEFTEKINDTQFKRTAEEAISFFTSGDLLFEKGKYGITVIHPGIDIISCLGKAQKFYQCVREKVFYNQKKDIRLYMGLTSRSGRLVNAERLMFEASEALNKAKKYRESSIIAFKSDLEKYREFVKKRG